MVERLSFVVFEHLPCWSWGWKGGEGSSNHSPVAQWMGWHTPLTPQQHNTQHHHPCQATLSHERVVTFTEQERVVSHHPFLSLSFSFLFLWFSLAQSYSGHIHNRMTWWHAHWDDAGTCFLLSLSLFVTFSLNPLNALEKNRLSALSTSWIIKDYWAVQWADKYRAIFRTF